MKKKGQGLVEYALILVLIAIVVFVMLTFLGGSESSIWP
jgi:Flp pilus assembly pilin Flp